MSHIVCPDAGFEKMIYALTLSFGELVPSGAYQILTSNKLGAGIKKISPENETELWDGLTQSANLFDDTAEILTIIDLEGLKLTPEIAKKISLILPSIQNSLWYKSQSSILAPEKKLLETFGKVAKIDKTAYQKFVSEVIQQHLDSLELKPNQKLIQKWLELSNSVRSALDCIDIWRLSGGKYDPVVDERSLPIFMYSWNPNSPKQSVKQWIQVGPGETQLALSMLMTKMSKGNIDSGQIQKLIRTDQLIKTNSKISERTWYLSLLWKLCLE